MTSPTAKEPKYLFKFPCRTLAGSWCWECAGNRLWGTGLEGNGRGRRSLARQTRRTGLPSWKSWLSRPSQSNARVKSLRQRVYSRPSQWQTRNVKGRKRCKVANSFNTNAPLLPARKDQETLGIT